MRATTTERRVRLALLAVLTAVSITCGVMIAALASAGQANATPPAPTSTTPVVDAAVGPVDDGQAASADPDGTPWPFIVGAVQLACVAGIVVLSLYRQRKASAPAPVLIPVAAHVQISTSADTQGFARSTQTLL
jgi:hypothetical protein